MSLLSMNVNACEACVNISEGGKNNIVVFNQVPGIYNSLDPNQDLKLARCFGSASSSVH